MDGLRNGGVKVQRTFLTASDWLRHESRQLSRPVAIMTYGTLGGLFITGFLLGTMSASWFNPIGLPFVVFIVIAYSAGMVLFRKSWRRWKTFRKVVNVIADRSLAEERAALGDDAWRVSVEMTRRITLEELDHFKYPERPTFEPLDNSTDSN